LLDEPVVFEGLNALGTARNTSEAKEWLRKASEQNIEQANEALRKCATRNKQFQSDAKPAASLWVCHR